MIIPEPDGDIFSIFRKTYFVFSVQNPFVPASNPLLYVPAIKFSLVEALSFVFARFCLPLAVCLDLKWEILHANTIYEGETFHARFVSCTFPIDIDDENQMASLSLSFSFPYWGFRICLQNLLLSSVHLVDMTLYAPKNNTTFEGKFGTRGLQLSLRGLIST